MSLEDRIQEFEIKRNALLDELESLDTVALEARPFEGKWSVIEIVEHMVIGEREVLAGLPDPKELRSYDRSFKNKLMLKVVMFVLGNRIRVKVPSKTMIPKGGAKLGDLRAKWDENQAWFQEYVASNDEKGLRRAVFKHPVSGPIDVYQAVEMCHAHFDSHSDQIRKLLDELARSD